MPRKMGDVPALEHDPPRGRVEQSHDAARHRRLAAAGLADDAQGLAFAHGEGDPVHRFHGGNLLLEDDPARDREMLLEVLHDQEVVARTTVTAHVGTILFHLGEHAGKQLLDFAIFRGLVEMTCLKVRGVARDG